MRALHEWFIYADGGRNALIYEVLFYGFIGVLLYGRWLSDPEYFAEVWREEHAPLHAKWAAAIALPSVPPEPEEPR